MPMVPPAPPVLSMRIVCFNVSLIAAASTRVSVAVGPPAAAGTTMTTGLTGYSCASAVVASNSSKDTADNIVRARFIASLHLDAVFADELAELVRLGLHVAKEFFGRAGDDFEALLDELRVHLRRLQGAHHAAVHARHHLARQAGGVRDAGPGDLLGAR